MWLAQSSGLDAAVEKLSGEEFIGIYAMSIFWGSIVLIVLIVSVTRLIRSVRVTKVNSDLVNNLANRGFSPAEIRDIVVAASGENAHRVEKHFADKPPVSVPPQKPIVHTS